MRPIDSAGFQGKFTISDDPWSCRSSHSEALKRRRAYAGLPLVSSALDVACGDGAGTQDIAARALHLDALDASEAALASAGRLIGDNGRVRLLRARAPDELPRGRWRRIVVSELVYYLAPHEIATLADALVERLAPGGVLIAVHHVVSFDDARTPPAQAVALFHGRLRPRLDLLSSRRFGRYAVARWRRRRGPPRGVGASTGALSRSRASWSGQGVALIARPMHGGRPSPYFSSTLGKPCGRAEEARAPALGEAHMTPRPPASETRSRKFLGDRSSGGRKWLQNAPIRTRIVLEINEAPHTPYLDRPCRPTPAKRAAPRRKTG